MLSVKQVNNWSIDINENYNRWLFNVAMKRTQNLELRVINVLIR